MTTVPKLSEMRHALAETPSSDIGQDESATGVPTFEEMAHVLHLYQTDQDAYLEHYGVKGMKWGITRSKDLLGRLRGGKGIATKDSEGDVVGGIRARTRAGAQKLKDMRAGSTLVVEDANGASKILSKQKDGTFKEVYLSADAERVLRATKKAESELSDKEINDAINRSKKIEEYNKLFNPQPNPNADLEARARAMELTVKIKQAESILNPPKKKLVNRFVDTVSGGYGAYARANKATNNLLNETLQTMITDLRTSTSSKKDANVAGFNFNIPGKQPAGRSSTGSSKVNSRNWNPNPRATDMGMNMTPGEQKRVDDFVQNITTVGQNDFSNPFIPELER